jgi:TATA-box binding protein (TBP) (component of TFIID and TFIIIB)
MSNNIIENKYDTLNYTVHDGIKIYTGTTYHSNIKITESLNKYKNFINPTKKIFTELVPSTLTAKGYFTNISFEEAEIIDMLSEPSGGFILKIGCNYGEIENKNPDYVEPPPKVRVSNRGRKPKLKPKSKRKVQGSGKYFSSQITFNIYNPDNDKIYKIKLFRNGKFQVPGVKKPDMTDLIKPIKILRDYLRKEFVDDNIEIQYFISVMRNYICRMNNDNILIRLSDLETLFKNQKNMDNSNPLCDHIDNFKLSKLSSDTIKKYLDNKQNEIGIAEIQNNCERYFGLILKFYRPVMWKMNKRTTIKILRSGKINIDGGNSIEEAYELYHWLEYIFTEFASVILFDKTNAVITSDTDTDSDSVESIYDDDL